MHDVDKSLAFYKDFLGYAEAYRTTTGSGGLHLAFIKINDRQYIEIFPEREADTDRLNHIAVETDDAKAMRAYLAAKGVKVPDKVPTGKIGNANFNIADPDGHTVEIVQYLTDGWSLRDKGKFVPDTRISTRIMHVGISVGALDKAMPFYKDILGFSEIWRGSSNGSVLSWVNMKCPDSDDYIEFMLYGNPPTLQRLHSMHHIALEVPDMDKALATLESRPARKNYRREMRIATGINRKRQLNLYDPDGTRIELMEPKTVDGVPALSSTAPPPGK